MRKAKPGWSLRTELLADEAGEVTFLAVLKDENDRVISTGHAQEVKPGPWAAEQFMSDEFKQNPVEVCETSAVGRCLAFASWPGSEIEFDPSIASADEVANEIKKQIEKRYGEYMKAVHAEWDSIVFIKNQLAADKIEVALEAFRELGHDTMSALWRAPTKGGIFTVTERKQLKEGTPHEPSGD